MEMARKTHLSDEEITELIEAVRTLGSAIWNPDDDNYCGRFHVHLAWKNIAKATNLSEDLVRVKWKNLRDLFKREIKNRGIQSISDYIGKWKHFKTLWFLYRPEDSRSANDSINDTTEDADDETFDNEEEFNLTEEFVKNEPSEPETPQTQSPRLDTFQDPTHIVPKKRMKTVEEDYDVMFLKSLTPYFKQLQPLRKLMVRNKIHDLLLCELTEQNATSSKKPGSDL